MTTPMEDNSVASLKDQPGDQFGHVDQENRNKTKGKTKFEPARSIHTSEIDDLISDGSVSFPTSQMEFTSSTDDSSKGKCNAKIASVPSCSYAIRNNSGSSLLKSKNEEKGINCDNSLRKGASDKRKSPAEILESVAVAFLTSEDDVNAYKDDICCSKQTWPNG